MPNNNDDALLWVALGAHGTGEGGTDNYSDLKNKPKINGFTLSGEMTADTLGLGTYTKPIDGIPYEDLSPTIKTALEKLDTVIASFENKTVQEIVNTDGSVAELFNAASGGGARFTTADGTEAFVGVNDGSLDGLVAQIYADELVNGSWVGSRINVYHDHIYYTSLADVLAGKEHDDPTCEIATIGDIEEALGWQDM